MQYKATEGEAEILMTESNATEVAQGAASGKNGIIRKAKSKSQFKNKESASRNRGARNHSV